MKLQIKVGENGLIEEAVFKVRLFGLVVDEKETLNSA